MSYVKWTEVQGLAAERDKWLHEADLYRIQSKYREQETALQEAERWDRKLIQALAHQFADGGDARVIDTVIVVLLSAALLGAVVMVAGEIIVIRMVRQFRDERCFCGFITIPDRFKSVHDKDEHMMHSRVGCQPCREAL